MAFVEEVENVRLCTKSRWPTWQVRENRQKKERERERERERPFYKINWGILHGRKIVFPNGFGLMKSLGKATLLVLFGRPFFWMEKEKFAEWHGMDVSVSYLAHQIR